MLTMNARLPGQPANKDFTRPDLTSWPKDRLSLTPTDIEYAEQGGGTPLLLVPGSFGTGAGWRGVIEALGLGWRVVTTSLLGYGATAERRSAADTGMTHEVDALEHVVDRAGTPLHVAAHSFGGVCVLALAMRRPDAIRSLTLIEANPIDLLRQSGEGAHMAAFRSMSDAYLADHAAGLPEAARRVIDFYGGPGAFDAFPDRVRRYVVERTAANVLDWATAYGFAMPIGDYARIAAPTLLVRGASTHPAMHRIQAVIAATVPSARLVDIPGGRHFLPATHPAELARLITDHVAARSNGT